MREIMDRAIEAVRTKHGADAAEAFTDWLNDDTYDFGGDDDKAAWLEIVAATGDWER